MSDQLDPRLVEIDILTEADRAFVHGGRPFEYRNVGVIGPLERQRHEAIVGLLFEGALVGGSYYPPKDDNEYPYPHNRAPNPSYGIDAAAVEGLTQVLGARSIVNLRITQRGRLRLFRLRDEILQRDRVRDDFGILLSHRHWLPDLEVRLRFREPPEPLSLIVLDVDHLKALNKELGHPGADQVLIGIFQTLRDAAQPHEAYRIGGDEAGAILPRVSHDFAMKLAEEICASVAGRAWPAEFRIQTRPTVSVGVGTYTSNNPIRAEALYRAVDAAAARAKVDRNRVEAAIVEPP
jgi:diguanylate cyclase (GGDEF)-like protein